MFALDALKTHWIVLRKRTLKSLMQMILYLKTNKNKLHFIQKTQNLERNIYQKNFTPFLEDLEARGFFIFDIEPRHSKNLFLALDEILNDFLNFIDTEPFF